MYERFSPQMRLAMKRVTGLVGKRVMIHTGHVLYGIVSVGGNRQLLGLDKLTQEAVELALSGPIPPELISTTRNITRRIRCVGKIT